jgi:hypothetical protein
MRCHADITRGLRFQRRTMRSHLLVHVLSVKHVKPLDKLIELRPLPLTRRLHERVHWLVNLTTRCYILSQSETLHFGAGAVGEIFKGFEGTLGVLRREGQEGGGAAAADVWIAAATGAGQQSVCHVTRSPIAAPHAHKARRTCPSSGMP